MPSRVRGVEPVGCPRLSPSSGAPLTRLATFSREGRRKSQSVTRMEPRVAPSVRPRVNSAKCGFTRTGDEDPDCAALHPGYACSKPLTKGKSHQSVGRLHPNKMGSGSRRPSAVLQGGHRAKTARSLLFVTS